MTAKEAREAAINSCKDEIEKTLGEIKEACKAGNTIMSFGKLKSGTVCYFIKEGYTVETNEVRDGTDKFQIIDVIISW